ncbi:inositol phosphatase [Synechococcus sp. KORDI-52]|uniref:photosystem II biogenesis protein Psp29 n=1 Tax=Synechococcus sp. KORDI-52 TaxID=585425 RepID=UPI0004E02FB2|nr:photosystem II biogenesis protein Psp29 [Synechococcus sp. KORDI-52]AII49326.1 inositol phosphatase [Synechococcus sp. KORDI-52]
MAASQTIADSKRAFHQAFPHVIAPLYRRLADELLVELHLLSHQSRFEANELFSVGLCTVFDTFTKGYRPEAQTDALFSALCSSNGFDAAKLRKINTSLVDQAKGKDPEKLKSLLSSHRLKDGSHYSRLMAVGLMSLLKAAAADASGTDSESLVKQSQEWAASLGMPADRVEKDLTLFGSNSERMDQAVELVEETIAAEKRKKERRLAEQAQRSSN